MAEAEELVRSVAAGRGLRLRELLAIAAEEEAAEAKAAIEAATAIEAGLDGPDPAERFCVRQHAGCLILPYEGAYVVAQPSDAVAKRSWLIGSPLFATVGEAKAWIDIGRPDGTEGLVEEMDI